MPSYYIPQLNTLVSKLNTSCGYSGRYTLIRRIPGIPPDHGRWAIMKKEGQLDRNVSGWATPLQLRFWVQGHLEGYSAHERRSPTGRLTEKQPELSGIFKSLDWAKAEERVESALSEPPPARSFDPKTLGDVHGTKIP